MPSQIATAAMASPAAGSAHYQPSQELRPTPSRAAPEVKAQKALSAASAQGLIAPRSAGAALGQGQQRHDDQGGGADRDPGHRLPGPGLSDQIADALHDQIGGQGEEGDRRASFAAADLSEPAGVERLAAEVGEVDVLVNNAGFSWFGATADLKADTFDALFASNVRAPYFLVAAFPSGMAARVAAASSTSASSLTEEAP
jgi:NAD(P)-dependent dehydrogenase (short-subunit alcohol dehydrogenase family)